MSTKIHNGYRLAAGTDLFGFCADLRAVLNPVRDQLDAQTLAVEAAALIDRTMFNLPSGKDDQGLGDGFGPLFRTWHTYETGQRNLKPTDHSYDPNRFNLSIGWDAATGRYLLLRYSEARQLVEAFEQMPQVEEYRYWNNTDAPDGMTETEWSERNEAWLRVSPYGSVPAETMLTFELRANPDIDLNLVISGEQRAAVLAALPAAAERAKGVLRAGLAKQLIKPGTPSREWFAVVNRCNHLADAHHQPLIRHIMPIDEQVLTNPFTPDPATAAEARQALADLAGHIVTTQPES